MRKTLKDITIGQYIDGNSILHRINPSVKIIMTIAYVVLLFLIKTPVSYVVFTVFTLAIIFISTIPLKILVKGLKPMMWIFILTAVLNVFMTPGEELFRIWAIVATREGIYSGVLMLVRLIYLVLGTSLLTLTTSPLRLTDGIEILLKPFEKIKVPSHEIAMMMTIAIRFIPTLAEETDKIMKAQTARGADFESGNFFCRIKSVIPILIPLFINSFRRADELATAMESRCYGFGIKRTKMNESKFTKIDFISIMIFISVFIVILLV